MSVMYRHSRPFLIFLEKPVFFERVRERGLGLVVGRMWGMRGGGGFGKVWKGREEDLGFVESAIIIYGLDFKMDMSRRLGWMVWVFEG